MIEHPYELTNGSWMRGNLHCHTTRSDGKSPPQAVIDAYAGLGHGFLMISDHDIFTRKEEYGSWDSHGMIMIPGNEITAEGPHILHVGADRRVDPLPDRQAVIDNVAKSSGFAIMNHPNWQERFDHFPINTLNDLSGYAGIEIYNGVIGFLEGSPYATNKWDMLLTAGRHVWGFANDDCHRISDHLGLGWNTAYVTDRSPEGVVDALRQGSFYASTGVEISEIRVSGRTVRIQTVNASRIVALREYGRRVAFADSNAIEIEYPDGATYVRFECWGDGEKFAWTQPFWQSSSRTEG